MPSTPLICCSNGVVRTREVTSALAPAYPAVTCTMGGTISGYCAIGSVLIATNPTSTIRMAIEEEKIGRSIKKRLKSYSGSFGNQPVDPLFVEFFSDLVSGALESEPLVLEESLPEELAPPLPSVLFVFSAAFFF